MLFKGRIGTKKGRGAMSDSQEYRNRAKECFRIAERSPNPLDRQTFSELAAAWLRLANEIDTNQALIEHWGALDRPTDTLTVYVETFGFDAARRTPNPSSVKDNHRHRRPRAGNSRLQQMVGSHA